MVKDDTMKANSKLHQNSLDVLAVETKPNDANLTVHILYDFITRLSINNIKH